MLPFAFDPLFLSALPTPLVVGVGGCFLVVVGVWLVWKPSWALFLLLASLVAGQLIRLPLPGQGGGLLISDVAVVIVELAVVVQGILGPHSLSQTSKFRSRQELGAAVRGLPQNPSFLFIPFLAWSVAILIWRAPVLGVMPVAIAGLYWVRLATTLLLFPTLLLLFKKPSLYTLTRRGLLVVATGLAVMGFFQLAAFPNLQLEGWDPHQGRLLATWLDPNFLGIFFAILIPFAITQNKSKSRFLYYLLPGLLVTALLLTQSRSAAVASVLTALVLSPVFLMAWLRTQVWHRFLAVAAALSVLFVLLLASWLLLGDRATHFFRDDPTVALRQAGLQVAWQTATAHPWLGVGYNAYQFALERASGSDFTIHSRAGADNSLLTLWVTTGLIGVILFLLPFSAMAGQFLIQTKNADMAALAPLFTLVVLVIDSQFINSLLYSQLLITLVIILALSWQRRQV